MVGWIVIAGVVYLVVRAVRKWRREWKHGLEATANAAAEAAASAVAHADMGGVHLHIAGDFASSLGAGRGNDNHGYLDATFYDNDDARRAEVRRLVSRLAELSAGDGAGPISVASGSGDRTVPVGDADGGAVDDRSGQLR